MHIFIEELRNRIEYLCGDDVYLSSFSFLRLNEKLGYEKSNTSNTEKNRQKCIAMIEDALSQDYEWHLEKEFKAWVACFIREMGKAFLNSWANKMLVDFVADYPLVAADEKKSIKILERACFDANLDPNSVYLKMHALAELSSDIILKCNIITDEIIAWQKFCNNKNLKKTAFGRKRILIERNQLFIYKCRQQILSNALLVNQLWYNSPDDLKALWRDVYIELFAFRYAFEMLLDSNLDFVGNYAFTDWLNKMFPAYLSGSRKINGAKNPIVNSKWFNRTVIGIKQATYCLSDYLIKNKPSFSIRDRIINQYIKKYSRII